MDEKEIYEICMRVDSFIADRLTESIVRGTSYDMLEAHYGILPISRNCFYRKRRIAQRIMKARTARLEEEKNGQYMIVWGKRGLMPLFFHGLNWYKYADYLFYNYGMRKGLYHV